MFRFEYPEHLYALAVIPVLILFFAAMMMARKQAIRRFGNTSLMQYLMPQVSKFKHTVKFVLLMAGVLVLIIGWANPQWGTKREKVQRRSVDVFIALDISQSMLAPDVPPNRLERAKRFGQNLVEALKGERIGLIIFAGNAYLQMPLTTDYAAAALFLKSANPAMAPTQGTAFAEAIDLAERSFEEENKNHKALVLITDGENHEEGAQERAQTARDNGLLLFTVGVGTTEGSFIPTYVGGRSDFKRDRTGQPVRTQLNEEMLQELAASGNGAYFNLASGSDAVLDALKQRIDNIEKRELEQRVFSEYESYFQYFLGLGLLFVIVEFLLPYRRSGVLSGRDLFEIRE